MTTEKKSWRDVYKVHPAADLFPMLPENELKKLGEDIKANGLKEHVVFWSRTKDDDNEYLLDGRNRLEAMELVRQSVPPFWKDLLYGHEADPYTYVISRNIRRRHLTKEQQADLIVKVMKASTDFAKAAKSVKRDSGGRVKGSTKDPFKEKVVEEAKKHGISKRTAEKAIAKEKGPTQKPGAREKKPPKLNVKAIAKASERMKLQQDSDAGWITPEQARARRAQIEKKFAGVPDIKIGESVTNKPVKPPSPEPAWLLRDAINRIGFAINAEMDRAPNQEERYRLAV